MISSTSAIQALRVTFAAVALGGVMLTAGHAAARNHDIQVIRLSSTPLALHDRAPGPFLRAR